MARRSITGEAEEQPRTEKEHQVAIGVYWHGDQYLANCDDMKNGGGTRKAHANY